MPSSAADLPVGAITRLLMATIGNWAYVLKCKLAVASARRREDPLKLAHTIRHLGDAYYYAGRWALPEPCYVEALSIYRRHERSPQLDLPNATPSFAVLKDEAGGAYRSKGSGVFAPWRGTDCRPLRLRRRASRPQLKRDPLGRCSFRSSHALSPPVFSAASRDPARRQDGPHQGRSEAPVHWHLGCGGGGPALRTVVEH